MTQQNFGSPPYTGLSSFDNWARGITQTLSELPTFSVTSTADGPEGNLLGSVGHINIDVGSSVTKLWIKHTPSTTSTGWKAYNFT